LKHIQQRSGTRKLKKLPKFGFWNRMYYLTFKKLDSISPLNWVEFNKAKAKATITEELGWRDYGGKHFESVFTRFYQGYILPRKFNIDKRKAHLSTMIFAGEISKETAVKELEQPPYDPALQQADKEFVAKKLGFTDDEFEAVLSLPNVPHEYYGTDEKSLKTYRTLSRLATPLKYLLGKK
jgi:deoxyribodipyrimidine photolyase